MVKPARHFVKHASLKLWNMLGPRQELSFGRRNSVIHAEERRVWNPSNYGGVFKRADKVVELGLGVENKRELPGLLSEAKSRIGELKKKGYSGAFFDTPNEAVIIIAKKRFGAKVTTPPLRRRFFSKLSYRLGSGIEYPEKWNKSPVKRVIIKF